MSSVDEKSSDPLVWSVDSEIHLFEAMLGHKPAGVNKHFHMMIICEKLSTALNREITSEVVWKYLETLYNLDMIDEIEGIPFPNDIKDFSLPESEYGTLMKLKLKEVATKAEEVEDRSISPRGVSSRSQSRSGVAKENASKSNKKDQEKAAKNQGNKDTNSGNSHNESSTPAKEKESTKSDPRRDSKDSTSSNKESSKATSKSKETKSKSSRSSTAEKHDESLKSLDDSVANTRANKRSTRGSLKPEEPTPPSRRRRI